MNIKASDRGRVLIVDDNQNVRDLLVELLEEEGYELCSAPNGAVGQELVLSFEPDLVISDVVMPVVDGFTLCRNLKKDSRTSTIPVLLVSGLRNSADDSIEGLTAGADDYLDLPFRHEELLVKVARLVERHRVEKHYRDIVERAADIIYARDMDGFLTSINAAGAQFFGKSANELIGIHLGDLIDPIDAARDIAESKAARPGVPLRSVYCLKDGEGRPRYLEGVITVERDRSGNANSVRGVVRDITEQRLAENALKESGERYRKLFENATDIIYTHDLAGNFTSLNTSGERITGYSRDEACQMNVADVIAPEYLNLARRMTAQKAAGNAPTVYELEIVSKAGRRVRLEVSTQIIYREGYPVGVQGIGRDLTERKRSEEELRETRAFFHSFMDNSPAVAFMKDEEGRYVYVNRPFEKSFGQSLGFLEGRTSFDWLPNETAQATHEHDLRVLATGQPQEIIETILTHDGAPHHWLVFKFPTTDTSGQRFVAGVGVDITERRRAEEALGQQAQREAMSHRISQAIRCSLDSAEVFETAVRELGSYLNVDRCSLFMRNDRAKCATNVAEYHSEGVAPAAADFALSDLTVLINALDEKGVLAFSDAASDPQIADTYERILAKANVRSIMYVAIRVGDEVPAAFALSTTKELRHWTEADIDLAKAVADQTGIAIRQAELYQKAETTSTRESLVNRLTMTIRASLSLSEVLSTATRELGRALSASRVLLHLYSPESMLSPVEHEYVAPDVPSLIGHTVSYDDLVGQYLLKTQKPLIIDDGVNYTDGPPELSAYVREYSQSVMLRSQIDYPLIVKGLFRGVLCIHQTDRVRRWSEDELVLVEAVAERLSIGMAQAELFEMVARGKQEWETTFDAMSDGIFIFDRNRLLRRVNRAGASLEDEHPRDLLGRRCCDLLRTSSQRESCAVERAIEEARGITIEITPERLCRPLLVTIEPILNSANKPDAVVCTARDLSELRNAQAVVREHQSLLTNILESARESIYAVDLQGRFKWVNTATVAGLGFRREEFIGRHLLDMVYEGDRRLVSDKLAAALQGEAQTYEMRYYATDGRLRYARVDNSPLVVDGRTTGVLGIARDITEQKEERERAARADKLRALGQLASGVAHDFNNSLAAILGRAQLLCRQTRDEGILRNLEIIQTAAEDAAATVRRIQTFARKSAVKEFEMLDVRGLLNDAIEITRTRWENEARLRGLDYTVMLEADGGLFARGSASELREVFVNLIVNAVDAMPHGGRLALSCIRDDNRLKLQFADNGAGMPEDVRQKIFEPFFSTKGAHGTGLGLSVSYSIIERHGGAIHVDSEPGKGTVFTIVLPAAVADSVGAEAPLEVEPTAAMSILVIDDEPPVRETLADMLEMMNHKVVLAESGQAALAKIATQHFDLVFSDLAMPEMDGWETARAIRKRRPDVKIILVTGYGPGTTPPSGEEDLVNAVIGKPFDFAQVTQTITQVIANGKILENVGA